MNRNENNHKIERVYVACYKYDFWQTKICVASIRKWYPTIEIYLIKDNLAGGFNSEELEKKYDVKIANYEYDRFGWGVSKFEPYFDNEKRKFLILDSDTVFLGHVIEYLDKFSQPFVISANYFEDCNTPIIKRSYYNIDKIQTELDSEFSYPGYVFNTGQIVGTSGIFNKRDFNEFIEWGNPSKLRMPHILSNADQGILNYFFHKQEKRGLIEIGKADFMIWGYDKNVNDFGLDEIINGKGYPKLIHWAGNINNFDALLRQDIIEYYQKLIQLRKNHPAFRMKTTEEIRSHLDFCTQYQLGIVSYCIQGKEVGDRWDKIIMIFNGQNNPASVALPEGNYRQVAKGDEINEMGIGEVISDEVKVEGISMVILVSI